MEFILTPVYQATTQLLVNQEKSDLLAYNVGDIQTNLQLINTYNVIIKSPAILNLVKNELALDDISVESLNTKIMVASEGDSQVVTIKVQDPDPFKNNCWWVKLEAILQWMNSNYICK